MTKEIENMKKPSASLADSELAQVAAGGDTDSLRVSGKPVPLPKARSKKAIDGGYDGNIVPGTDDAAIPGIPEE